MIMPADDKPLKGGLGGGAKPVPTPVPTVAQIDPRTPGKDLRLIASAVRKGWVIPDEAMTVLPAALLRVALIGTRKSGRGERGEGGRGDAWAERASAGGCGASERQRDG